jgi:hypothetical protein
MSTHHGRNIPQLTPQEIERFWAGVTKTDECWLWHRCLMSSGYGLINIRRQLYLTHRVAWTIVNGKIPKGLMICHVCDRPNCVAPAHLFLGDQRANLADMRRKGRWQSFAPARGAKQHLAKLTDEDIIAIRKRRATTDDSLSVIAEAYGVTPANISYIVRRKTWTHIK